MHYTFPSNLPTGCSAVSGSEYSCGALTLAAGDTITIASPKPAKITFSGALVTGAGVFINADGYTSDLTFVVNGAVTLGAGSLMNANLQTLGAGAVTLGVDSFISGNVSTETGFVAIGAATIPPPAPPAPQQTGIGGNVSTITGYVSMGTDSVIKGSVTTQSVGYVALGANAKVGSTIFTLGVGYVALGASAQVGGSIIVSGTTGADYVTTGAGAIVSGNISTAGSYITLGAGTQVSGNISTKISYISVGATSTVGGQISMNDPTPSYIAIGVSSKVYAVCCNGTDASCVSGKPAETLVCVSATAVKPANFSCLETGLSYNNVVSDASLRNPLYTKLAGTSFRFDLVALKTDGTIETSYASASNKSVSFELVDGSGGTACAARTAIVPAVSQILTFSSSDVGRKAAASITVSNAYTNLRCRVTDASQSPSIIGCSSDNFSVRPTAITLLTSASAASPSAVSSPSIKSGANFTLGATTNASSNYSGVLNLDSSKLTAQVTSQDATQQAGGIVGVLTAPTLTANTTAINTTYSEAGYLYLAAGAYRDEAFTMVDSANGDCITDSAGNDNLADTLIGGKYGCHIGNKTAVSLGRFYPDHFSISTATITAGCSSSNPFTYFGQDSLLTKFTLTAQNLTNNTTQNYAGVFAKLDTSNYLAFGFSASPLPAGSSLLGSVTGPINTWKNGAISVSAKHQISRPTVHAAEATISISASPTDGEIPSSLVPAIVGSTKFRYGRLKMKNTYGSELLSLPVPLEAQYWNGLTYIRNQDDSCTTVPASSIAMSNFRVNLTACKTHTNYTLGIGKFNNGLSSYLNLSKPGMGNNGSVDLTLNLNNASGNSCTSSTVGTATAASIPWFGANPVSRATFGIYKSAVIYLHENY